MLRRMASFFDDLRAPRVPGVLGFSNSAAAMSAEGLGPRLGGAEPASPWAAPAPAAPPLPTFMQQQPAPAPQAPGGLTPEQLAIPGAAQAAAIGVPPWMLQVLYGGYT